jgi:pyruvate dehydrogenase E2 component (dihydrolipoamide acetyltransferase)
MALSMSVDHRAIDGAAGASFMKTVREIIERPEALFA